MNRYPAKPIMDQMAQHGRYGDTMLVHMNPVEVAGIAALSPTGKLTTNPVTGQPEAFLPLLFGALGGALKLGTLGTAALSGIGTAAITGDLKRGLLAGVTSGLTSGIGEAFADAGSAADTVTSAADTAGAADAVRGTLDLTDATAQLPLGDLSGIDSSLIDPAGTMQGVTEQLGATNQGLATIGAGPDSIASQLEQTSRAVASTAPVAATPADPTVSQQLFGGAEDFVNRGIGSLGTSGQLVGAMTTEGVSQQMQAQQDFEREQQRMREESEAKRRQAYEDLQGAYSMAQPGAQRGYSPYRSMMSRNTPPPYVPGMQEGGVVPTAEEQRVLDIAGRGDILGAENQAILEAYYNRLNAANQAANQADDEAEAASNTLFIEEGATNQEALQALKNAGLVPTDAYNWLMRHYRESGTGDSQYFASQNFPGAEEWLSTTDFTNENKAYLRQILPLIQQGATTGIPLSGGEGSVEDIVAYNPFGGYYGAGQGAAYGGLDPVTIQKNLRGGVSVAPPRDYMPGFEPEFSYFQENPDRLEIPDRSYRPTARRFFNYGQGYFDPIMQEQEYLDQLANYYTQLGGYGPDSVTYPTETESTVDDPDTTTGGGDNVGTDTSGGDDGSTDTVDPVTPTGPDRPTRAFVNTLYQELFGRDARDAGYEYWAQQVVQGNVSADKLRDALIHSAMTGHPEDHPDRMYLTNYLYGDQSGGVDDDAALTRSALDALYQELFGRDARDPGYQYWLGQVEDGVVPLDRLRDTLIHSAMAHPDDHDDKIYLMNYLYGDDVPPPEEGTGDEDDGPVIAEPGTEDGTGDEDGTTPEYGTYGDGLIGLNNSEVDDYVTRMMDVAGVDVTSDGSSLSGQERAARKEKAGLVVRDLYYRYLGREPDEGGLNYYTNRVIGNGARTDTIVARELRKVVRELMGSDEGQAYASGLRDGTKTAVDRTVPSGNYTYTDIEAWMAGGSGSKPQDLDPTPDADGYYSAANARDVDRFLWSRRNLLYDYAVKADSKGSISASDFNKKLSGQTGRYGGRLIYDPESQTIYEGVTDNMSQAQKDAFLAKVNEIRSGDGVPMGIDPSLLTPVERTRMQAMLGSDAGSKDRKIGNTQYFVDEDGGIVTYQIKKIDRQGPGFSGGGTVPLRTSMGDTEVSAGGIANVPTEFTASMPSEQEFSMVAAAVLGRLENPDAIVDMFVKKYGPEMFQRVREYVLRNVAPNAQTEGMIRGQGSGMDDKVPGMIGDQQPVAVSPGEFIVPADVVSGLGDGSSDAGAKELDKMMDRVRMARGGTTKQAPSIDAGKIMPA